MSPLAGATRPPLVERLPSSIYLEVTNRCDSRCRTCVRTFRTVEPPRDVTLEDARRIAAQFPVLDRVVLHGIGEPLLNRDIFEIVRYFKSRGATVLFNSDAISLTRVLAERLIASGLDELRVSMDAAAPATYEKLRGVDQFDRVVANVARLIEIQHATRQETPRVSLWFTANMANVDELPDFVRLAARLGVSEVHVQRLVFNELGLATRDNSLHGALCAREERLVEEAHAVAVAAAVRLSASGLTTPLESLRGTGADARPWAACERPWTLTYITANGNVLPCCISPWVARDYPALVLGNAFERPIAEIWNGERYQRFRREFESDTPPDACRGCGRWWSI
jgi:radical SAM protein with 4Fe4S-binding SPASM domain